MEIDALFARMAEHPDDVAAYAVLGDALHASGDPHGELIALQCAVEGEKNRSRKKALRVAAAALLEKLGPRLLGALAGLAEKEVELTWFCGHVAGVTLRGADSAPILERLQALLALPVGRVLRTLRVALRPTVDFSEDVGDVVHVEPYGPVFAALSSLAAEKPLSLRELELGDGELDLVSAHLRVPRFALELQGLSRLERLTITAASAGPGAGAGLPQLRSLALHLSDMEKGSGGRDPRRAATLEELTADAWPALERLELWIGGREVCYINPSLDAVRRRGRKRVADMTLRQIKNLHASDRSGDVTWEELQPRLAALVPPKVTHLALGNLRFTDTLVAHLPRTPWWPRLRTLDLSHGTLGAAGAQTLVGQAAAYAHLESLILDGNVLGEADVEQIRQALPQARADDQRAARDPAFVSRYVASVE